MKTCPDCGVKPGELHELGCDVERCSLCGNQKISCECFYKVNKVDPDDFENVEYNDPDHPEIKRMEANFNTEIDKYGGRLPWTGEWPGIDACQEFNLYAYCVKRKGWIPCSKDHPNASEDLNKLHTVAKWNKVSRKWELRKN